MKILTATHCTDINDKYVEVEITIKEYTDGGDIDEQVALLDEDSLSFEIIEGEASREELEEMFWSELGLINFV